MQLHGSPAQFGRMAEAPEADVSMDKASAGDDTAMDSTLESLPKAPEFDFDDKLDEFKDDLIPNLVRDLPQPDFDLDVPAPSLDELL